MLELLYLLMLLMFSIAMIGCIPYGIWVWITAFRGNWKRVGKQLAYPAVVFAVVWGTYRILDARDTAEYLRDLYDTDVTLGKPVYEYASERAFNGDGFTLSVYELPTEIRQRFQSADDRLLKQYPIRPRYRNPWSVTHWTAAPFDPQYEPCLEFALSEYDLHQESSLEHKYKAIRATLVRGQSYYAFFNNGTSNIDFFVVDLEEGKLYVINHNT